MISDLAQTLQPHRQFLLAFSGGLDSTVLLHRLVRWREQDPTIQLRAIHIHHGLSANADGWVAHCQQVCQQWQVPLLVERVVLGDEGLGIEAHARQARYQAFRMALLPGEALVTAQHLDDQCETFLLALKRGSGPTGLSAMSGESNFAGTKLLRPLLNERRESLYQWAMTHQLTWIEDESNQDDAYDRNFLRLRIVPLLSARWPHFAEAVARSASLCGEQEQLLDEMLAAELVTLMAEDGSLAVEPLTTLSAPRRAALLRRWLGAHNALMPSRDVPERIWREVAQAREDAFPCLRLGDFTVRRYQQRLHWVKYIPGQTEAVLSWPDISEPLLLPADLGELALQPGGALREPNQEDTVTIRFRASGNLHIVGRHGGRKLKKIWQELGVAPWRRDTTPLLFYGETLIAAADGLFVTQEGRVEEGKGVQMVWRKTGDQGHPF
ncbi:tRNA lysidine(34) synthetase TilS [Klebsiella huaxiensis]|uniref:tRNA(Ile)-lysidine synthase n=1 Tax=Klebsiella huaxiensis TaxID=2153354 RepID=A0ABT6E817_9ENTR|nr:tRNA lysidine(34) synthetase TilS [Klebsiella huaxiensis]MDG1641533.1 tRNA lysidine(34) synthetase TilS [Klebsiella huaxiensis]QBG11209.1 tRNA lysidine(34) synthetase TilS [Klebsiella huaxiensis]